ncbi:MAG: hypothetical protein QOJ38_1040 [Solirubrobacterales bacterium]|jgi:hypothetical protein|nr:hypothetical protein [Solirubrobacterales bacterium]
MAEATDKPQRIEIGFSGGQVIAVRLKPEAALALRGALDSGDGWHDIATEDGEVAIDLSEVVFVRGESGEHRVGFTSA